MQTVGGWVGLTINHRLDTHKRTLHTSIHTYIHTLLVGVILLRLVLCRACVHVHVQVHVMGKPILMCERLVDCQIDSPSLPSSPSDPLIKT